MKACTPPSAPEAAATSPVGGTSSAPYDFSLWYVPEDDHVASRIAERLREEGFRGFTEHQDQAAGTSAILTAMEAIEASRVAILLLSARSVGDRWCQRVSQWNLFRSIQQRGPRVLPVCVGLSRAQLPPFLQHLVPLEYQNEFFFQRLLASLRARPRGGHRRVPPKGAN
uniref:TIR domain-containing protein n=1 Tax=Taeniopygia guttata TaxID=59729 RepID=A0A674HQH2_TAEGU